MSHRDSPPAGLPQRHRTIFTSGHPPNIDVFAQFQTAPAGIYTKYPEKPTVAMLIKESHTDVTTTVNGVESSMRIFVFHPTIPQYPNAYACAPLLSITLRIRLFHVVGSLRPTDLFSSPECSANVCPVAFPASSSSARSTRSPAQSPASPVRSPARAILLPRRAHTMTSLVLRRWHTMFPVLTRATPGRSKRPVPFRAVGHRAGGHGLTSLECNRRLSRMTRTLTRLWTTF